MLKARRFNWKLFVVVIIAAAVLAGTGYGLRQWNRTGRADRGLAGGLEAYEKKQWHQAAFQLGIYIANTPHQPEKIPVIMKYAQAQLNTRPLSRGEVDMAIESYRMVQRIENEFNIPTDQRSDAIEKLVNIYLLRGAPEEAELIINRALKERPTATLRRYFAQSLVNQRKFQEGAKEYRDLIQDEPDDIMAYEGIGLLSEIRQQDFATPAQHWFDQAVSSNPDNFLAYAIRAEHFYRTNNIELAQKDLTKAMSFDLSDDFSGTLRLIRVLLMANDLESAQKHLLAAGKINAEDQKIWHLWFLYAFRSNDKQKQIDIAHRGLETLDADPWDFMPSAIELFLTAEQYDQAGDYIEKLRDKKIAMAYVAYFDGRIAEYKGDYYAALRSWNQALQEGLISSQLRLAMARIALLLGNGYEAAQHLQKIIDTEPDNFLARLKLATVSSHMGHWKEVEEHAQVAHRIDPQDLTAWLLTLKARVHRLASEQVAFDSPLWDAVEEQYQNLENMFQDSSEIGIEKVRFATLRQQYGKARTLSESLLQQFPDQPEVHMAGIQLNLAQGKQMDAVNKLSLAIDRFDKTIMFDKLLARWYLKNNQADKCQTVLTTAIQRMDDSFLKRQLQLQLNLCYQRMKDSASAYALLEQMTHDYPQDINIKAKLLKTPQAQSDPQLAQTLIEQIKEIEGFDGYRWRYEQAHFWFYQEDFYKYEVQIIGNLREVLVANPNDTAAHLLLAKTYERSGKINLALMTYRDALNNSSNNTDLMALYAALLYRTQDFEQGDAVLDQAKKLNHSHPLLDRLELYRRLRLNQMDSATSLLRKSIDEHPDNIGLQILLVRIKIEQKNYQEAAQLLNQLRQNAQDSLEILELCIDVSLLQNDEDQALHYCRQLLQERESPVAYYLRAKTYARLNRIDEAVDDIEKTTSLEPDNIDLWIEKSRFYVNLGLPDKALVAIRKALTMDDRNLTAKKMALELLLTSNRLKDNQEGRAILKNALKMDPQDLDLRLIKARLLILRANAIDLEQAESILLAVVEKQPLATQAWTLLSQLYLSRNQPGKALNVIMKGLTNLPNNKTLLFLKSRAEFMHSPHLAINTLKDIHELYPDDFDIVLSLAKLYGDAHQPLKAIELLQDQMNEHQDPAIQKKIHLALITMQHLNGEKDEAYQKLEQLDYDDVNVYSTCLDLYFKDQRWNDLVERVRARIETNKDQAKIALSAANRLASQPQREAREHAEVLYRLLLKNDPENTQVLNDFGQFLHQTKRFDESARLFEKIIEIDPQRITAINNLSWIMAAELKNYDNALELAMRGLDIEPEYPDLLDTRGLIYFQKGDYKKSVQDYEHCLSLYHDLHPSQASVYLRLAQALAALDRKDQARLRLEKAHALNQDTQTLTQIEIQQLNHLYSQLQ